MDMQHHYGNGDIAVLDFQGEAPVENGAVDRRSSKDIPMPQAHQQGCSHQGDIQSSRDQAGARAGLEPKWAPCGHLYCLTVMTTCFPKAQPVIVN